MVIGIDIDGTITNHSKYNLKYGKRFFQKEFVDSKASTFSEKFGENDFSVDSLFWSVMRFHCLLKHVPIRNHIRNVTTWFEENNIPYIILTNRKSDMIRDTYPEGEYYDAVREFQLELLERITMDTLEVVAPHPKKIIYNSGSKLPVCLENGIDIMIEDDEKHILELSKQLKVIKINTPYNKNAIGDNIFSVDNWNEIIPIINKFKGDII